MKANSDIEILLRQAVERAAESDYFLAKVFRVYKKLEKVNTAGLAQQLGCSQETLVRLALCRRPNIDDSVSFKADVERISQHFSVNTDKLAALVRYVDTMEGFSESPQLTGVMKEEGILLTARDQEEDVEKKEREKEKDGTESEENKNEENETS